jgi:hypothetical protein
MVVEVERTDFLLSDFFSLTAYVDLLEYSLYGFSFHLPLLCLLTNSNSRFRCQIYHHHHPIRARRILQLVWISVSV